MSQGPQTQPTHIQVHRFLEPIFPKYLDVQKAYLAAMDQALAAGDLPTLQRLGHTIKGGAATYELFQASALGARLEAAAAIGAVDLVATAVALLHAYFTTLDVSFTD